MPPWECRHELLLENGILSCFTSSASILWIHEVIEKLLCVNLSRKKNDEMDQTKFAMKN